MITRGSMIGIVALLLAGLGTPCHGQKTDILDFLPAILAANTPDYWVNALVGNDGNPGTKTAPFRTITHALSVAGTGKTVKVLPGTYDSGLGEIFPIVLQAGQVLVGDRPNRGDGLTPTLIVGRGETGIDIYTATIMGAEGSEVSGFTIGEDTNVLGHTAIWIDGVSMRVCNNTLKTPTYSGVMLRNNGTSVVEKNVFDTSNYGVRIYACPDAPVIRDNEFLSMSLPCDIAGSGTNAVVRNNTISGSGQVGIQVQHGQPRIENNTFKESTGYVYGAIRAQRSTAIPVVRGNTFLCTKAIRIDDGNPDLGIASENGDNDFSAVTGISVDHMGSAMVQAIGNSWPNSPPLCGTDITTTGGGSVAWGTEGGEQCP